MAQVLAPTFGLGINGDLLISSNTTDAPIDSAATATIATKSVAATNASFAAGQLILIHQTQGTGAGQGELNRISSYSAGTITTQLNTSYGYVTGAQVLVFKEYTSVTIQNTFTLTAKAWNGTVGGILGWFCNGTTTVTGTISANGQVGAVVNGNSAGGAGIGYAGGTGKGNFVGSGFAGEGNIGGIIQQNNANGSGGGGGYSSGTSDNGGGGGGGSHQASGVYGSAAGGGGAGGSGAITLTGVVGLTLMTFGGGGGGGTSGTNETNSAGAGGGGGGIIFIIGKTVSITGAVNVNGGNGGNGIRGGGGGAGGSVLIKAQTVTLGANLITAAGGSGAGIYTIGGAGSVGRIRVEANTLSGSTSPTLSQVLGGNVWQGRLGPSA